MVSSRSTSTPSCFFKNGDILTDVTGLSAPGGLEAHRRAHPDHWTRWRHSAGQLQLAKKDGWENMRNLFAGGSQEVTAWTDYRFAADGRLIRGGGAGSRAEAGDWASATSSAAPNRRGRYTIDGLTLHITYDDRSTDSRILIADPSDPKTAIWLDGVGYVQRKQ